MRYRLFGFHFCPLCKSKYPRIGPFETCPATSVRVFSLFVYSILSLFGRSGIWVVLC